MELREHTWGGRGRITLNDVAKEAGVSQSVASVVLNGAQSGTRVSPERKLQVLEVARRMGYRPNALAQSLITGRTDRIGVYSGRSRLTSRNAFVAEILGGIFEAAADFRVNTVVHTSGRSHDELLSLVSNGALDGLIVHASEDDPIIPLLSELRAPAVALADPIDGLPSVGIDDRRGGTLVAQHLASLGHKRVLLKQMVPLPKSGATRMGALREEAVRLGMEVIDRPEATAEESALDSEEIRLLTEGPNRATAIACWSDATAEKICNTLWDLGISMPSEVAVTGFDGFIRDPARRYSLTTVHAPWFEVGNVAARLVMALVNGDSVPSLTTIPVEFIKGSTT
jgi:LacI family transcriptional regulator